MYFHAHAFTTTFPLSRSLHFAYDTLLYYRDCLRRVDIEFVERMYTILAIFIFLASVTGLGQGRWLCSGEETINDFRSIFCCIDLYFARINARYESFAVYMKRLGNACPIFTPDMHQIRESSFKAVVMLSPCRHNW